MLYNITIYVKLTTMKNEAYFQNINPKFAETVMRSHNKSRQINEELLQLISRVRLLEDNLLEEQYRYEMLVENNNQYKERLNLLKMKSEGQQAHLKRLNE